jgi:hypothetical protein
MAILVLCEFKSLVVLCIIIFSTGFSFVGSCFEFYLRWESIRIDFDGQEVSVIDQEISKMLFRSIYCDGFTLIISYIGIFHVLDHMKEKTFLGSFALGVIATLYSDYCQGYENLRPVVAISEVEFPLLVHS